MAVCCEWFPGESAVERFQSEVGDVEAPVLFVFRSDTGKRPMRPALLVRIMPGHAFDGVAVLPRAVIPSPVTHRGRPEAEKLGVPMVCTAPAGWTVG